MWPARPHVWSGKPVACRPTRASDSVFRPQRRVLNTGSGPVETSACTAVSTPANGGKSAWTSIPRSGPDLVGSVEDMRAIIPDASFDAIWSSHSLEHLHSHQVQPALREFRRILKSDGFSMITCPDLERVAAMLLDRGLDAEAYQSPARSDRGHRHDLRVSAIGRARQYLYVPQHGVHGRDARGGADRGRVPRGAGRAGRQHRPLGGRHHAATRLETVAHMLQGTSEAVLISA